MKALLVILSFVFVGGAMWMASQGVGPKPVRKMSPTSFERLDQVGVVAYRRLWNELRKGQLIVVGSHRDVEGHENIWTGFLKAAQSEGFQPDLFIQQTNSTMPQISVALQKLDLINDYKASAQKVNEFLKQGLRVIVHTETSASAHGRDENFVKELERLWGQPVPAISMIPFVVQRGEEVSLEKYCNDKFKSSPGCTAIDFSKRYFRKNLAVDKLYAGLEQLGRHDYVLYVYGKN